jgi:hypothetical protein
MHILYQRFEALVQHMRINLCGRNIRMPKHLLHASQISAVGKQMRSESMAENMR